MANKKISDLTTRTLASGDFVEFETSGGLSGKTDVANFGMGAWDAYSPAVAHISYGGTGSLASYRYKVTGKTCIGRIYIAMGTGAAVDGSVSITLPVPAYLADDQYVCGVASLFSGAATFSGTYHTSGSIYVSAISGSYLNDAALSSTVPFTWGSGCKIIIDYRYETA